MIRTPLCELFGIEHPVVQAGMGPFAPAALAAAVSNAGGLGSIGTFGLDPIYLARSSEDLHRQFDSMRGLTDRPFAINLVVPYFEDGGTSGSRSWIAHLTSARRWSRSPSAIPAIWSIERTMRAPW